LGSIANPRGCFSVGRAREIREFSACRVDAERGQGVGGALRGVQEFSVRRHVQVRGPDVVVVLRGGGPPGAPTPPRGARARASNREAARWPSSLRSAILSSHRAKASSPWRRAPTEVDEPVVGGKDEVARAGPLFHLRDRGRVRRRRPDFSSKTNWKIWSVPRFGA